MKSLMPWYPKEKFRNFLRKTSKLIVEGKHQDSCTARTTEESKDISWVISLIGVKEKTLMRIINSSVIAMWGA